MNKKIKEYTFQDHLKESLKDPEFRKAWEESEVEYNLMIQLIENRLRSKLSQRALAKKVGTSQAAIARVEGMDANPSLGFLKKLAIALDSNLEIKFIPR
jgi:ribosome-binding protein aMBF1 (putative translation factor)